jgi:hypothetical protein
MSTGYDSSIDALRDLLSSQQITDITANLSHLTNGIEYSFVEVTCNDGVQYGLQAYGKEALELNRVALQELVKISLKKPRILPMIVSS